MSHDHAGWRDVGDQPPLTGPEWVMRIAVWVALIALCVTFWVGVVVGVVWPIAQVIAGH